MAMTFGSLWRWDGKVSRGTYALFGICGLTVKRLRDAGQPLWLTLLFFAPIINLLFFGLLMLLPGQQAGLSPNARDEQGTRPISPHWPTTRTGSALAAVVMT